MAIDTQLFVQDLRQRVIGQPEISTDGYTPYANAIRDEFGANTAHGIVDKALVFEAPPPGVHAKGAKMLTRMGIQKMVVSGAPEKICTNMIERQNLNLRMSQKRFARGGNAFSKKFEHHCAAVALYVVHFNFCKVSKALRITPAMHLGLTDHVWTISELVAVCQKHFVPEREPRKRGPYKLGRPREMLLEDLM